MEKYEKKSKGELIEILKSRSLSSGGRKADLIARLLKYHNKYEALEATRPDNTPDLAFLGGRYLLYDGSIPRTRATVRRIRDALCRNNSPASLIDIDHEANMCMFWYYESKGRTLPAIVKQGCVIGDLGQLRRWIESDDLKKSIDEACEQAGVGAEDPPGLCSDDALFDKPIIIPEEYKHLSIFKTNVRGSASEKSDDDLESNDA